MDTNSDHNSPNGNSNAPPNLALALRVHGRLAELIRPATVGSIRVSSITHNASLKTISIIGLFALFILVLGLIMMNSDGSSGSGDTGHSAGESPWKYVAMISAAIVGSSFYALYTARNYLRSGTFDPNLQQDYLVRFALGILAGFILANIPDVFSVTETNPNGAGVPSGANGGGETPENSDGNSPSSPPFDFGEVTLAFVGGFLPRVVYLILTRIGDSLAAVFDGRGTERARAEAERTYLNAISSASTDIDRILTSMDAGEITPTAARAEIRRVMSRSTFA